MHLLIAGKSAFARVVDGKEVPISVAGHTVQFTRPLLSYALARGARVSYMYPLAASESDCLIFDPDDSVPDGVAEVPFTDHVANKSPVRLGWISVEASLRRAVAAHGPIDWVVLASTFPLATVLARLKPLYGYRLALFVRGHDGYQWLDPEGVASALGDPAQAGHLADIYRESMLAADFVAVASEWLGGVVAAHGARWDMVVESPAATGQGRWDKRSLVDDPGVVVRYGAPDPSRKWLLTAGRMHADKHLDLAAEIFDAARPEGWQLVVAGTGAGPDPGLGRLARDGLACVLEVPPRIIHGLFQAGDAYLQTSLPTPSFVDARPSSVTSAAFHGLPVVLPVGTAGGAEESVARENVAAFGFDAAGLDPADPGDRALLVRRGCAAVRLLSDAERVTKAGAANAAYAAGSSVDAVFGRMAAAMGW
ncbi:glycosyltransferase [Streptomyces sp. NPDC046939]|uniref:glycosyltransferase n=1 Tax=Streptomyces sp. NPDC046939 TaxID=3155376 RepID=UPI003403C433